MNQRRNILALDIAFGPAAACLLRYDGSILTAGGMDERPHSQAVMPLLEGLVKRAGLGWGNIDMLAAGIGPGSFTGLRIAAATLAGINSSLQLPLLELSSLAISAMQCDSENQLHVIEDARAGLAYTACYRGSRAVLEDCCMPWKEIEQLEPAGYTAQRPDKDRLSDWVYLPPSTPRAVAMSHLLLGASREVTDTCTLPRFATPAYIIPSQAERHAQQ